MLGGNACRGSPRNAFPPNWRPLGGPLGGNRHPDPPRTPKHQKYSPHFHVILGSFWGPGCNQNRIEISMYFCRVLWATLGPFGEPTGGSRGVKGTHFRALWGDKWKCENYAPVEAKASLLRLEGVLRGLMCITSGPLVLSMSFGRDILQKVSEFESHRGSVWVIFRSTSGLLLAIFFRV